MTTSATDCSTIMVSLEDSMVRFLDHFSYPQHIFLLQDDDDPGIQIVFSSDAQIHACLGKPAVANIGQPPLQNYLPLAQGRHLLK